MLAMKQQTHASQKTTLM